MKFFLLNRYLKKIQSQKRKVRAVDILKNISTKDLVEELKQREAVETHIAKPYADLEVKVNGPAIVLVVSD